MRAICISSSYCQYKTDTGYCGYTGNGCALNQSTTIKIPTKPQYTTTMVVDISTESINEIAEAVVEKLRSRGAKMEDIE